MVSVSIGKKDPNTAAQVTERLTPRKHLDVLAKLQYPVSLVLV